MVTSYIGFACIIKIPSIYLSSIYEIPVKKAVGAVKLTKGRKQVEEKDKIAGHWFFNTIYLMMKWFFNSFYFYFFTFTVVIVPMITVLAEKEKLESK